MKKHTEKAPTSGIWAEDGGTWSRGRRIWVKKTGSGYQAYITFDKKDRSKPFFKPIEGIPVGRVRKSSGEAQHDAVEASKRMEAEDHKAEREAARQAAIKTASTPSSRQVDYVMSLLDRISNDEWFNSRAGLGGHKKPSRKDIINMNRKDVSSLISRLQNH